MHTETFSLSFVPSLEKQSILEKQSYLYIILPHKVFK